MIETQHLTKSYGNKVAVDDVSFRVEEGQTLVLLGTSGSGKTTTLRMLNRLVEPTSGRIFINGENILSQPPELLRRRMGYVLQGYGLFPHYTVAENIAVVPKLLKWTNDKTAQRTDELLHKLDLPPGQYLHVYPASLSGGQMQRVGLARALAADPPILLMDEPFGALDPLTRTAIRNEFKQLDELKKKTVILVTHDVEEAFELGNVIGLMDKGAMIQCGTPLQLLFHPATEFVRDFFRQQRLQLTWKSVVLKDVWNDLPQGEKADPPFLRSNQTAWEAMEMLATSGNALPAFDVATNTFRQLSFAPLQAAIQKLQKQA